MPLMWNTVRVAKPLGAIAVIIGMGAIGVAIAEERREPVPEWSEQPTHTIFFEDAFRDALVGSRPSHLAPLGTERPPETIAQPLIAAPAVEATGSGWARLIEAETLEDEVKRMSLELDATLTTPSDFASRGYLDARRQFTVLTIAFGVIHQYDGSIRWKDDAGPVRDAFAQVAAVAKVGSAQAFQAAKNNHQRLQDLIRGQSWGDSAFRSEATWGELVDRRPLMQRMERDFRERVTRWTASESEFQQQKSALSQHAQVLAMLTQVLTEPGMEDAQDEDYLAHCRELQQAAHSIVRAVSENQYPAARAATSEMSKACDACHESYRE